MQMSRRVRRQFFRRAQLPVLFVYEYDLFHLAKPFRAPLTSPRAVRFKTNLDVLNVSYNNKDSITVK